MSDSPRASGQVSTRWVLREAGLFLIGLVMAVLALSIASWGPEMCYRIETPARVQKACLSIQPGTSLKVAQTTLSNAVVPHGADLDSNVAEFGYFDIGCRLELDERRNVKRALYQAAQPNDWNPIVE